MNNIIRAYYFLFHVGVGCVMSFLPTYLKTEGFIGKEISSIISLGSLCGLIGVPMLWGWMSDRTRKPEMILKIIALGTLIGCIPLLFLKNYWLIFSTFLVYSFCSIGAMSILDSIASVRAKEQGFDFGKMRLFAPAGWLVGTISLGYYIDLTGKSWNDISVIIAIILSFTLMFLVALGMKKTGFEKQERPALSEIKALFKNKYLVMFFVMAMVNIMAIAAYWVYFGPLIAEKGLSPKTLGLSIAVGTLSEVIFMYFFENFKRWLGIDLIIIISIIISIGRWLIISQTSNPYVLVGIQVLHSEIGLFVLACVSFVTDNVPRKLVTTGQTIFYTLTYGIGQYIGIMLMGFLFDFFGSASKLFVVSSFIHIIPLTIATGLFYQGNKLKKLKMAKE